MKKLYGIDSISTRGGNGFDLYPLTHQGRTAFTRETERGGIHKTQNREFQNNKYMEISSLFRRLHAIGVGFIT